MAVPRQHNVGSRDPYPNYKRMEEFRTAEMASSDRCTIVDGK